MAQPGNFTPILLYGSSTPGNVPLAANLTNSATGSEIAINVADKNLFFKDSGGTVNTVPIRQSSTSSNGWLSSTDWNTFSNKSNTNGTVTSVAALTLGTTGTDLSSTVANGTTTPVITLNVPTASATNRGALSAADWSTFNGKQAALVSGTNIKTVGGVTLLGSGDVGAIGVGYGGTGLTSLTAGYIPYGNGTSAFASSANLTFDGANLSVTGQIRLNTSTQVAVGLQSVVFDGTTSQAFASNDSSGSAGSQHLRFLSNGTASGYIATTGATTTYVSISDYRLKENIAPMVGALNKILKLKPVTYDFIGGQSSQGFIAHELQAVVPDCVTGEKDAIDDDGNPNYQGVDTSFLVATLTAAIQEQQAIIETMQAKLKDAGVLGF